MQAQRDYFAAEHDGTSEVYAQRLVSRAGKHDGLYWPSADGDAESPFGPMLSGAACEGDVVTEVAKQPFHGYYFRTLCAQGAHAPGGSKSFLDEKGLMSGGFAMLAWPDKYGNSGVMTFQVNEAGVVFQKDLGPETEKLALKIQAYDPDDSWSATTD